MNFKINFVEECAKDYNLFSLKDMFNVIYNDRYKGSISFKDREIFKELENEVMCLFNSLRESKQIISTFSRFSRNKRIYIDGFEALLIWPQLQEIVLKDKYCKNDINKIKKMMYIPSRYKMALLRISIRDINAKYEMCIKVLPEIKYSFKELITNLNFLEKTGDGEFINYDYIEGMDKIINGLYCFSKISKPSVEDVNILLNILFIRNTETLKIINLTDKKYALNNFISPEAVKKYNLSYIQNIKCRISNNRINDILSKFIEKAELFSEESSTFSIIMSEIGKLLDDIVEQPAISSTVENGIVNLIMEGISFIDNQNKKTANTDEMCLLANIEGVKSFIGLKSKE